MTPPGGAPGTAGAGFRCGFSRIDWRHPDLGRIKETACSRHEGEVLAALTVLGIGGSFESENEGRPCDRCVNDGVRPRAWLNLRGAGVA